MFFQGIFEYRKGGLNHWFNFGVFMVILQMPKCEAFG
jgi:hypothetical protein